MFHHQPKDTAQDCKSLHCPLQYGKQNLEQRVTCQGDATGIAELLQPGFREVFPKQADRIGCQRRIVHRCKVGAAVQQRTSQPPQFAAQPRQHL